MIKKIIFNLAVLLLSISFDKAFAAESKNLKKNEKCISNDLVLWLDSSDSKSIFTDENCKSQNLTNHENVGCWKDKSRNSNNAIQVNANNRPKYSKNGINGKPAIKFNKKDFLDTSNPKKLGINNSDYEIIIVAKSFYKEDPEFLIAGEIEKFEMHLNKPGLRFIPNHRLYVDLGSSEQYTDGNPHIFSARVMDDGTSYSRVDGFDTQNPRENGKSAQEKNLRIGIRGDKSLPFKGKMAEILIYKHALSDCQRTKIENDLIKKWAINPIKPDVSVNPIKPNVKTVAIDVTKIKPEQGSLNSNSNSLDFFIAPGDIRRVQVKYAPIDNLIKNLESKSKKDPKNTENLYRLAELYAKSLFYKELQAINMDELRSPDKINKDNEEPYFSSVHSNDNILYNGLNKEWSDYKSCKQRNYCYDRGLSKKEERLKLSALYFQKYLSKNPNDDFAKLTLALVCEMQGNKNCAIKNYREFFKSQWKKTDADLVVERNKVLSNSNLTFINKVNNIFQAVKIKQNYTQIDPKSEDKKILFFTNNLTDPKAKWPFLADPCWINFKYKYDNEIEKFNYEESINAFNKLLEFVQKHSRLKNIKEITTETLPQDKDKAVNALLLELKENSEIYHFARSECKRNYGDVIDPYIYYYYFNYAEYDLQKSKQNFQEKQIAETIKQAGESLLRLLDPKKDAAEIEDIRNKIIN